MRWISFCFYDQLAIGRFIVKPLFYLVLLMVPHQLFSQNEASVNIQGSKSSDYILNPDTLLNIKLNVNNEQEWFVIEGDDFRYDIRPNFSLGTSINASYRFLTVGVGFVPKAIPGNNDEETKGSTKALLFKLNVFHHNWGQQFAVGQVQGYYIANTSDFIPDWKSGDPYIQQPDLNVQFLRGTTFYKFNRNFSLQAISNQTEIQLKSAGSFIAGLDYSYYNIDNKSEDKSQQSSQRSQNIQVIAEVTYLYTFVLNSKWYIAAGLTPGIGVEATKLTTRFPEEQVVTNYDRAVYRLKGVSGIGYNSTRFYSGCEVRLGRSVKNDNISSVKQYSSRLNFQVFVGYRFNTPKIVKKTADYLDKINPFR